MKKKEIRKISFPQINTNVHYIVFLLKMKDVSYLHGSLSWREVSLEFMTAMCVIITANLIDIFLKLSLVSQEINPFQVG